ncbi:MAG TPA: FmdB family zinc ribbon protein [Candidatus Kapabacteria bacterium]|nr:FmdB family zinc ribbon protein [Candidatus Kapabacteria bacterium]
MPVYEYNCADCGSFTELRSITENSGSANCPDCGQASPKLFPVVNLRQMRPENRTAWERNERSAHAPHVCGSGCSHKRETTPKRADGKPELKSSRKKNSRPWMLGH